MTKEEILQEIEELKKKVEEMEEETFNPYLLKTKPKEKVPDCFYINYNGKIEKFGYRPDENVNYKYNMFNSSSYAELRKREIDLQDKMWEFAYKNGWKDEYLFGYALNDLYIIYYNVRIEEICISNYYGCAVRNNEAYFMSKEIAEKAIEKFGDEIIELYEMRANIAKGGNIND